MVSGGIFVSQLKRGILRLGEASGEVAFGLNPMRPNVRFGSLADILTSSRHVRPNNGHWTVTQIATCGPRTKRAYSNPRERSTSPMGIRCGRLPQEAVGQTAPLAGVWFSGRSHS